MKISEMFYSVQGEGITAGKPAVFIRLSGCNLICGGPNASLLKMGRASWWCDTEMVWRGGQEMTPERVVKCVKELIPHPLGVSIVWTGGEPLHGVDKQEFIAQAIVEFRPLHCYYHEVETNGTCILSGGLFSLLDQINCSPKLANSGMKSVARINPEALRQIASHRNAWFKFVITSEVDLMEIHQDFLPLGIPEERIMLMPGASSKQELDGRFKFVVEAARDRGWRVCSRYQLLAWDRCTGV